MRRFGGGAGEVFLQKCFYLRPESGIYVDAVHLALRGDAGLALGDI